MSYQAIICRLGNIRPHPNADRLKLATVFGYQIIVGLDAKDGDLGIFFPCDGKLSPEHLKNNNLYSNAESNLDTTKKGYFGSNGRVKAQKFRGAISEGFWQEIKSITWAGETKLVEGDTLTHINNVLICEKYYTPATRGISRGSNRVKKQRDVGRYKNLLEHYDTGQLRHNLHRIPANAALYISEKLHGSSGRTGYIYIPTRQNWLDRFLTRFIPSLVRSRGNWQYITGTRKTILETDTDSYYEGTMFRRTIHNRIATIGLHKGETLYYEIVGFTDKGSPIMGTHGIEDKALKQKFGDHMVYSYGCNINGDGLPFEIYVYRITTVNEDRNVVEYSWPQIVTRCRELGLKTVPHIEGPLIYDSIKQEGLLERCNRYSNRASELDIRHIAEGVVVRIEHEDMFTALKYKSFWFCELEGIAKQDDNFIDPEELFADNTEE